jgi:UDP-N-acetylmuramoyl-L-alanyl-D-glutamate--2,6-diaminopimelate ligase
MHPVFLLSLNTQSSPISLSDLIQSLDDRRMLIGSSSVPGVTVSGVVLDSRQVQPGSLFVALPGGSTDGHRYIPDAVARGASAIVGTLPITGLTVPYFAVGDGRQALALLSAAFYGFPARRLVVLGITGTDGKTTTANLIYQIMEQAGLRVGMISTVNAIIGDQILDTGFHVTTPEAPDIQNYLHQMVEFGLTHVILEATSHGLDQHRVADCDFDIGLVTNITHEHLDYHGSYEAYRSAKARLFTSLALTPEKPFNPPRAAVLNRDDSSYEYLTSLVRVAQINYGIGIEAQVRAEAIEYLSDGLRFIAVETKQNGARFDLPISSHLLGEYNVSNCLAAIATTLGVLELDVRAVQRGIASLQGVPGRMERIDLGRDFSIHQDIIAIVDFAHTPNALQRSLEAARQLSGGRVIAVFGSAGLRDRLKRHMMAEVSARLADLTVLTAEDPRTEALDEILAEMADGARSQGGKEGQSFWRIPDRGEALRFAVSYARPGDLVIACGKGHEQSMCFGNIEYAWDDRIAMRAALAERLRIPGPKMPYLPTTSP